MIKRAFPWIALFLSVFASAPAQAAAESTKADGVSKALKDVHAYITIRDYQSASEEAANYLVQYPNDKSLWEAYIKALAKKKDEKAMLSAWDAYHAKFGKEALSSIALENVAWGIIDSHAQAPSPLIRALTMIAALLTQNVKSIEILRMGLQDPNNFVRAMSAQIAANVHDDQICDEMIRCLNEEESWKARLEVIKSVGALEIPEAKPILLGMIGSPKTTMEEKAAATQALISMLDTIERQTIWELSQSDRAGLRYLCCELTSHFSLKENLDLVEPLLKDHCSEVRAAALEAIGLLRADHLPIDHLLSDPDPLVGIYAAWVQTLIDPKKGQAAFKKWMSHPVKEERLLAGAALAACGKYGLPLTLEVFNETSDPYLKMNLAVGLVRQQVQVQRSADALYKGFVQNKERWMWEEKGIFRYLAPSTVKHNEEIPHYPEAVNQLARLEILNLLAILRHPNAQKAIKSFIQEKKWGITGIASALLLTEGDDSALDLVQGLLKDPDAKVRLQAALMLALWGKGEDAINTLQEAYPASDRDTKEKILEAICHVGSPASLPFLIERLKEPYPTLRIITAAGILICLNH